MRLFEKYRPTTFKDMSGNYEALEKTKSQVLLMVGNSGTGKSTSSYIYANKVAEPDDITVINASSNNGVDVARNLIDMSLYACATNPKVFIVDEVHKASSEFFNALLIPIENPSPGIYWIFCTSEPKKIPDSFVSRCNVFNFKALGDTELFDILKHIAVSEHFQVSNKILMMIAEHSEGNARKAINTLEDAMAIEADDKRIEFINDLGMGDAEPDIIELVRYLWATQHEWSKFYNMLKAYKGSNKLETIRITALSYGTSILAKGVNQSIVKKCELLLDPWHYDAYNRAVIQCSKFFN